MYTLKCSCRVFEHPHKSAICPLCHSVGIIMPLTDGAFENLEEAAIVEPVELEVEDEDVLGKEPKHKNYKIEKTF